MSAAQHSATPDAARVSTMHAGLALALRDLRVAFAEPDRAPRVVLDIPELDIAAGGQVAICGPSGSGKTTLLNVLAGIEYPQRGTVRWGGVELGAIRSRAADRWRRETLGLVFQQFHLFSGLSALENVLLPLRFDRFAIAPADRERANELLERVSVPASRRVERLSRGEMQRVAVARALLKAPAVVLADEPTASLDRDTGGVVADLLLRMCREQHATLVVVTHDATLADRFDRQFALATQGPWRAAANAAVMP
jgi:putative ABC transport system ATP-binding protein